MAAASCFVIPETDAIAPPAGLRRVVLCCGKVYYDLLAERGATATCVTSRSCGWSSSIRFRSGR